VAGISFSLFVLASGSQAGQFIDGKFNYGLESRLSQSADRDSKVCVRWSKEVDRE